MTNQTFPYEHTPAADPRSAAKEEKVVTPTESRQAKNVGLIYVLVGGLALVIVAFLLVSLFTA